MTLLKGRDHKKSRSRTIPTLLSLRMKLWHDCIGRLNGHLTELYEKREKKKRLR